MLKRDAFDGADNRSRTYDLRITNALLYQLSYTGETLNLRNLFYRLISICAVACESIESDRARNNISDFLFCEAPDATFFKVPLWQSLFAGSCQPRRWATDGNHRTSGAHAAGEKTGKACRFFTDRREAVGFRKADRAPRRPVLVETRSTRYALAASSW